MTDHWMERLSEYLDGELPAEERAALEAHVETCEECAAALADLRAVVQRARSLPDRPPAEDLWPGIAARLTARAGAGSDDVVLDMAAARARPSRRRLTFTVPQLVAAGIALMVLTAGAVWTLAGGEEPAPVVALESPANMPVQFAGYEETVRTLEAELEQRRARLDPATVAVVEQNLRIIDRAIREARGALAEDPSSSYLTTHLAQTMRRKVELLKRATTLAGA